MRRAAALLALLAVPAAAEIIDRIAVSAGNQVITDSAIRRHLRMEAWDTGKAPDLSVSARRRAAARLTDLALVRRELELSRYLMPPMADVDAVIEKEVAPRFASEAELSASLARYGFTLDDLRQEILFRLAVVRFVEFRFRPGVQVSDAEVEEFYRNEYPALARAQGAQLPPLDDARETIREILAQRKTNQALENWLEMTRQQTRIQYFEEAFK
jgi:hypothetical protein